MNRNRQGRSEPTVTYWGATRTVTGSMHQVDFAGRSLLLDCGFYQGSRVESFRRNAEFPFRPKSIDAVLLTHAHLDHCGNLPNLVRQGFRGPIYCTPATRALTAVMLGDAAKIQEEDAAQVNRQREKGEPRVEALYDGREVYRTLLKLKAVPYGKPFTPLPGFEATFVDAGHLLGSAMIHLRAGSRSLTYTGDLGRRGLPILRDPAAVPPADLLLCESTYGGHTHETVEETAERLGEVVRHTAARGGKVIIPAFSVGRTQTILYFLHQLDSAGRLPDLPIYVDSPMAVRATEVFRAHPECFNDAALRLLHEEPDLFGDRRVKYVDKVHESIALNGEPGPAVIISASGMCEGGRVLHHLRHNVEDPRSTIVIASFQAAETLGRRIVERTPEIRILGRTLALKAEVAVLNGLSSHVDHPGTLEFLAPLSRATPVRLIHGDLDHAEKLAEGLRGVGFDNITIPERGDREGIPDSNLGESRAVDLAEGADED